MLLQCQSELSVRLSFGDFPSAFNIDYTRVKFFIRRKTGVLTILNGTV